MCKATVQSHKFWHHSKGLDNVFFLIFIFFNSFIFILFLLIYLFFPSSPLLVFVLWLLILFLLFVGLFFSLFILCAVFISLRVGLGLILRWSENKISYFGVVYKFLSVGMELTVIKELFIISYI